MECAGSTAALAASVAHTRSGACVPLDDSPPDHCVLGRSQVLLYHHDLRARALRASRRPTKGTATYLTTTRPLMLALSGTYPGESILPNEPVTKARTHFRSHPLHTRSQLDADRFTLQVTAKMCVDATMSEPTSIITWTAAALAAVSLRGWVRVVVIRGVTSELKRLQVPTVLRAQAPYCMMSVSSVCVPMASSQRSEPFYTSQMFVRTLNTDPSSLKIGR